MGFSILLCRPYNILGNDYFSRKLASAKGVMVSALYSGGEIAQVIDHAAYPSYIHRPVFDSLIGKRKDRFIQVTWEPYSGLRR
jgi:hypothetical protein